MEKLPQPSLERIAAAVNRHLIPALLEQLERQENNKKLKGA